MSTRQTQDSQTPPTVQPEDTPSYERSRDEVPVTERPADRNVVSLIGQLATAPDVRTFSSGSIVARLLVTTRIETDRPRTDVVPVTVWSPSPAVAEASRGDIVQVGGTVQRRFWTETEGRRSRVEVVADDVEVLGRFEEG